MGDVAFSGPMADKSDAGQVGSPMPGAVDKVRVMAEKGWSTTVLTRAVRVA